MDQENAKKPFFNFQSPTYGLVDFGQVISMLIRYFSADPLSEYDLIIGTDSLSSSNGHVDFISAIAVHRLKKGGIYFWTRVPETGIFTLRDRMYEEALLSIRLAEQVLSVLKAKDITRFNLMIHVDIGPNGETKKMLQEIVGMVKGNGFSVMTKPDSYAASSVADRHT
ncbi:MAG: ribonuclease H-like YkuK family protein [Acidobacteriaceae bacterium]